MEVREIKSIKVQYGLVYRLMLLVVCLLGCRSSPPTTPKLLGAQMELNRLRPQLDGIAKWIGENRSKLQEAANSLLAQKDTTRIGCSAAADPYVRVRLGDGRFIEGRASQINTWAGEFGHRVEEQRDLLRKAGCQGFTRDNDGFLKLFLRPNVFVAVPDPNNAFVDPVPNAGSWFHSFIDPAPNAGFGLLFERRKWIDHYRSWAEKGSDVRGDFCRQLPGDWFLCTERR